VQSPADFALTYNFQGTHTLGTLHSYLCNCSVFLLIHAHRTQHMMDAYYHVL